MSDDEVVTYLGSTGLVRTLHGYDRYNLKMQKTSNQIPTFEDSSATSEYAESLAVVVAIPVALVVLYFLVEVVVRVSHFCCCSPKRSTIAVRSSRLQSYAGPTASETWKNDFRGSNCFYAYTALLVGVFFAFVAAVVGNHYANGSTAQLGHHIHGIRNLLNGYAHSADVLYSSTDSIRRDIRPLAQFPDLPDGIRDNIDTVNRTIYSMRGPLRTVKGYLNDVDLTSIAHDFDKHSADVYGANSYTVYMVVCGSLLILLFTLGSALKPPYGRTPAVTALLGVADLLVMVLLTAMVAVTMVQLAVVMASSDICVGPTETADRVLRAHFSSNRKTLDTTLYYLYCDEDHSNPLGVSVHQVNSKVNKAVAQFTVVQDYASSQGDAQLNALVNAVGTSLDDCVNQVPVLEGMITCNEVHNAAFSAFNVLCRPFVSHVYVLLVAEGMLALMWILARTTVVYRCLRSCRRQPSGDRSDGELMAMGLLDMDGSAYNNF